MQNQIRQATEKYSAIVIILDGGKRAIASFNMIKPWDEGTQGFGGKGLLKWMLHGNSYTTDADAFGGLDVGKSHMVYAGDIDSDNFDKEKYPRSKHMSMAELEATFDCILSAKQANMKFVGEDAVCPGGAPLLLDTIDAIIGYEDETNFTTAVVYARNSEWHDKVWY
jgi:hypothetical protein